MPVSKNYMPEDLKTQRLLFRKLLATDFGDWLPFFQHPQSTEYLWLSDSNDPFEQCQAWFDKTLTRYAQNNSGMNVLIHSETSKLIGQCGLILQTVGQREELEIGYAIMPEFWNQGYASEAAIACRDYAFSCNLSDSLVSIIHQDNAASIEVAKRAGMLLDEILLHHNQPVQLFRIDKIVWEKL